MTLLKMMGIVMIIASGGMFGLWQGDKIRLRQQILEQSRFMVSSLKQTLLFTEETPIELMRSVSELEGIGTMDFVRASLSAEDGFRAGWKKGVTDTELPLTEADKQLLLGIGETLGSTDIESQARYLTLLEENLSVLVTSLRENNQRQIKLAQTLGLLLGVFVAIIII